MWLKTLNGHNPRTKCVSLFLSAIHQVWECYASSRHTHTSVHTLKAFQGLYRPPLDSYSYHSPLSFSTISQRIPRLMKKQLKSRYSRIHSKCKVGLYEQTPRWKPWAHKKTYSHAPKLLEADNASMGIISINNKVKNTTHIWFIIKRKASSKLLLLIKSRD